MQRLKREERKQRKRETNFNEAPFTSISDVLDEHVAKHGEPARLGLRSARKVDDLGRRKRWDNTVETRSTNETKRLGKAYAMLLLLVVEKLAINLEDNRQGAAEDVSYKRQGNHKKESSR